MKKFTHSQELNASAEQVIQIVTTEDYLRYRYEDRRLLDFKLDISCDDEKRFACGINRVVDPGDKIPSVAKRMVGDKLTIQQDTEWSRQGPPYKGKLKVTIPGMPGSINGDLRLVAVDDQRSQMETDGRVEVKIPLAGGQIERMLIGVAEETFAESMRSINDYLAKNK